MSKNSAENLEDHYNTREIATSDFPFIITAKKANCFLIKANEDFILIDSGYSSERLIIEEALDNAGCTPKNLRLILLTHGDFDHSGNSAYFREKYGAKIAMHKEDSGMVEHGDFFYSRTNINFLLKALFRIVIFLLRLNLKKKNRFKADIFLEDGDNLSKYGFNAEILHFPGHSKGSIGFLTKNGNLFCGDLLENTKEPAKFSLIDNHEDFNNSIEKLKQLEINSVYPGHGKPFPMEILIKKL